MSTTLHLHPEPGPVREQKNTKVWETTIKKRDLTSRFRAFVNLKFQQRTKKPTGKNYIAKDYKKQN